MTAYLRTVSDAVAKHGWMIQGVAPAEGQTGVSFAYTVGLTANDLPEIIIVGLPIDIASDILNDAARRHLATTIRAGDKVDDIASVPFTAADATTEPASVARALYPGRVTLLQLLWPDKHGSYPGDPGWALGTWQEIPR